MSVKILWRQPLRGNGTSQWSPTTRSLLAYLPRSIRNDLPRRAWSARREYFEKCKEIETQPKPLCRRASVWVYLFCPMNLDRLKAYDWKQNESFMRIVLSVLVFSVLFPTILQSFAGQAVVIKIHLEPWRASQCEITPQNNPKSICTSDFKGRVSILHIRWRKISYF